MKLGRFLKYLIATVAVLILAGIVVLVAVDFNDYKPELQAQVKQATGRDLTIDGDIKLALSLTPALGVSGVSFANAGWGTRPAMVTVERFEIQVALIPLLSGTIDIQRIVLKGADILLETNAEGQANYQFETAAGDRLAEGGETATIPVLRNLLIENARVAFRDGQSEKTTKLVVDTMSLKADAADQPIALTLTGSYDGNGILASGTLGSRTALLSAEKPYPLALAIEAGGAKVKADGTVSRFLNAPDLDIALSVEGQSLETLSPLAGTAVPAIGPYRIAARLNGDIRNKVKLTNLLATIGGSDLSGTMSVDLSGGVPAFEGNLKSTRIDIADFVKAGKQEDGAVIDKGDGRVFPDTPLPVEGLRAADAIVEISVDSLIAALEAKDVEIGLHLKGGDLKIAPLKAVLSDGALDGTARLNAATKPLALRTEIKLSKFDAGKFLTDMAISDLLEGRFNVDISVNGEGDSIRSIMAGLEGRTLVLMGEGRMKSTALETFVAGPTKILSNLFSAKQSEFTAINCVVSQFDIKDGLATSKALLFDTELATMSGKGTVNLASEALDLEIDPRPKSATINTAVPINVGGTLAAPSFAPNELAAARKVGGLLGAFVFPPALLVGLAEVGTGEENPCLKGGEAKSAAPEKSKDTNPVTQPLESIKKGVGGVLNKLFGN